jgi:uncharacterized protein (TIGR02246 family)
MIMRSLLLTFTLAVGPVFPLHTNAQTTPEVQAIHQVITEFVGAINRGDTKAFAALFTEDADFVVVTGKYLKGRSEIVTYHTGLSTGDFRGSYLEVTSVVVRFLRDDVAVARVATKRTKNGGKQLRTSFPMLVLTKQDPVWLITAVQNTLTSGPPISSEGAP